MKLETKILGGIGLALCALAVAVLAAGRDERPVEDELVIPYSAAVKGFDPVRSSDVYSSRVISLVYEPLYQYHYLKRPMEVQPCLAAGMPERSPDGLTWTIRLDGRARFIDDACFPGGKGRPVTADDVVYSLKRLANQKFETLGYWTLKGKIVGLDDYYRRSGELSREQALAPEFTRRTDVEGLRAVDRHTVRLRLVEPYPQLIYILTMTYTMVVPYEAVEHYGDRFVNHPVGSGPYRMTAWRRKFDITFEKNPDYRETHYPTEGMPGDKAAGMLADAGKRLPICPKVRYVFYGQPQTAWLQFLRMNTDFSSISEQNFGAVVDVIRTELTPEYKRMGIDLAVIDYPQTSYIAFNNTDPLLGRPAGEKGTLLRRAMSMAVNRRRLIEVLQNGRAVPARGPIPPGFPGYRGVDRNPGSTYNVDEARRLLAQAGYPGGEGLPQLVYDHPARSTSQDLAVMIISDLEKIGIKVKRQSSTWPRFIEKVQKKQCQMWGIAWVADYPDSQNFLMLFYGPNAPSPNACLYDNPEFNELYARIQTMQPSNERTALYVKMEKLLQRDGPWIFLYHPQQYTLKHGWVRNYKPSGFAYGNEKYYGIDLDRMRELMQRRDNR